MAENAEANNADSADSGGIFTNVLLEIVRSPINIALVGVIILLVYKIYKSRQPVAGETQESTPELPKLRKDFTVEELKEHSGDGPDGRILIAVNGKVFDVTKGKRFYGPGGPYSAFGGRDASRGLATFSVDPGKDEYDDLSDLNSAEMDSVREWEMQFTEKYDYVGQLLKPGEKHSNYSDEEEDTTLPAPQDVDEKTKDD